MNCKLPLEANVKIILYVCYFIYKMRCANNGVRHAYFAKGCTKLQVNGMDHTDKIAVNTQECVGSSYFYFFHLS